MGRCPGCLGFAVGSFEAESVGKSGGGGSDVCGLLGWFGWLDLGVADILEPVLNGHIQPGKEFGYRFGEDFVDFFYVGFDLGLDSSGLMDLVF